MPAAKLVPGLKRLPKPDGFSTWYWAASQISRKNDGFYPRTVRLWHGQGQPSAAELDAIALKAERTTLELEEWLTDPKSRARGRKRVLGTVYFLRTGAMVKIGFSRNPIGRIRSLRTAIPGQADLLLTLKGARSTERALHRRFRAQREHGEWFRYEPPLLDFIEREQGQNHPFRIAPQDVQNRPHLSIEENHAATT